MARFEIIKKDVNGKTSTYYVNADNVQDTGTLMHLYTDEVNKAIERKEGEAICSVTKYEPKLSYWERRKAVEQHSAECGWNFVEGNPAY